MQGHNSALGGGGFHHVAVAARDFDRSVRFYTDVLGMTAKIGWGEPGKRALMLDTGDGNYIELFERPNQPPLPAGTEGTLLHLALRTNDTAAAMQRAKDAGCEVWMETKTVPIQNTVRGNGTPEVVSVTIAFIKGPDGELIEFFQNEVT